MLIYSVVDILLVDLFQSRLFPYVDFICDLFFVEKIHVDIFRVEKLHRAASYAQRTNM